MRRVAILSLGTLLLLPGCGAVRGAGETIVSFLRHASEEPAPAEPETVVRRIPLPEMEAAPRVEDTPAPAAENRPAQASPGVVRASLRRPPAPRASHPPVPTRSARSLPATGWNSFPEFSSARSPN